MAFVLYLLLLIKYFLDYAFSLYQFIRFLPVSLIFHFLWLLP